MAITMVQGKLDDALERAGMAPDVRNQVWNALSEFRHFDCMKPTEKGSDVMWQFIKHMEKFEVRPPIIEDPNKVVGVEGEV